MKNMLIRYTIDILQHRGANSVGHRCQPSSVFGKCFLQLFGGSLGIKHCVLELHFLKVWVLKTIFKITVTEVHDLKSVRKPGFSTVKQISFLQGVSEP